jgi:hypothetical protein
MRIFYILFIALLITVQVKSQDKLTSSPDQNSEIKIARFYPNPATSFITFEFKKDVDNNRNYTFQVYNFPGKKMYEAENVSAKTVVDLSSFFPRYLCIPAKRPKWEDHRIGENSWWSSSLLYYFSN